MSRDPRYDILFEPVKIGPVTARNRFYQVPHCNGMGTVHPSSMAAMRGVKAEGGWAVICTEECDFHHTGDITPAIEARLWSDQDIPIMARMVEAVKEHGALAGCELVYGGHSSHNRLSREIPMTTNAMPVSGWEPGQARAMDKTDIANFRRWHRQAALRARDGTGGAREGGFARAHGEWALGGREGGGGAWLLRCCCCCCCCCGRL